MSGSFRYITVKGREWKYKIGRTNVVANAVDNNEKRLTDLAKLLGMEWHDVERGKWKGWLHVTPKHIADWLAK